MNVSLPWCKGNTFFGHEFRCAKIFWLGGMGAYPRTFPPAPYQVYKSDHPTQRYGKYGKDSYYLLGDYYTIQVNENGSIGTFYKNRTISNK
jgi:hypothetical protein